MHEATKTPCRIAHTVQPDRAFSQKGNSTGLFDRHVPLRKGTSECLSYALVIIGMVLRQLRSAPHLDFGKPQIILAHASHCERPA